MIALLAAAIIASTTNAQETEELEQPLERQQGKEVFTVLKSNHQVKHGPYKRLNFLQQVNATGFYKDNKKDSTWQLFNVRGGLVYRGNYLNDEKTGVWEYYAADGELEQKYDHTEKKLIYSRPPRINEFIVYDGNDTMRTSLDQPPVLIGGGYVIQNTMIRNLRYPYEAIDRGKTGTVMIAFDVDVDGSVKNYRVFKKVFKPLDNEALRVIKLIPKEWLPGIKDGKKVKVMMLMPVTFKLEN